ncbi:MAG: Rpn family recombination-promoting nuclease/putative transposase [Lachnospiraceae bacterium]|nr:Rpn family recombination-promoting nuclease/putative transposase [Lachnospiraceae bacterium]
MGKKDIKEKAFMKIPANFADLCNGVLFEGEQVIKPEELEEAGTEVLKKENSVFSDVAMRWKKNNSVISVIEVENQSRTDYAMVIRNLNLIASHYQDQIKQKWAETTDKGDTKPGRDEFLSEMMKDTLLTPVIVIVVYYNEDPWKGKRRLFELLDLDGIPEKYRDYLLDYKMILFDYHDYDNYEIFTGEMKRLCEALCLQKDKDALIAYFKNNNPPVNTAELLNAVMNMKIDIEKYTQKNENNEEVTDMCTAIRELIEDGREEGRKEEHANTLRILNSVKMENNIEIYTQNGEDETDMCTALKELYEDGHVKGRKKGLEEGRKEERANTERERKRAEKAEQRVKELEAILASKA